MVSEILWGEKTLIEQDKQSWFCHFFNWVRGRQKENKRQLSYRPEKKELLMIGYDK